MNVGMMEVPRDAMKELWRAAQRASERTTYDMESDSVQLPDPADFASLLDSVHAFLRVSAGIPEELEDGSDRYECCDCGYAGPRDDMPEARNLAERIAPGEVYTDRECPKCGALAYPCGTFDEEREDW